MRPGLIEYHLKIYILGFHRISTLLCHPIEIADPNQPTLLIGLRLTSIMGKNTSAGFRAISLPTDCALEYCGSNLMGVFELLCFVFIKSGTPIKPDFSEEYASSYYGWIRIDTSGTMVCFKHRKLRANYSNRKNYSFNLLKSVG